jgi:hypothetical protein
MPDTKLFKVTIAFEGEAELFHCGAIEYQGAVWLVPKWLPMQSEGYTMPERIIRLDQFQHQRIELPSGDVDFAINVPVPRALFVGPIPQELKEKYVVVERPDIKFRTGGTIH